jgi:hypothetical protein
VKIAKSFFLSNPLSLFMNYACLSFLICKLGLPHINRQKIRIEGMKMLCKKLSVVVHACNLTHVEAKGGGS